MRRRLTLLLLFGLMTCGLSTADADAAPPRYIVLTPHSGGYHGPYSSGTVAPVGRQGYAYGWFGAHPRRHRAISYGYYNNYTQWLYK